MRNFLNKVFKLDENKTTIKVEIIGGLTTFFAMCYIVILNPSLMLDFKQFTPGADPMWFSIWNACFIGGLIAAVIATLCMAFIANKPFALAAGMGLNSFFFVSFIGVLIGQKEVIEVTGQELANGYSAGLAIILISGLIFLLLSITGVRKYIALALPKCLKSAISAGIGLFIALIGLKNAGIVVDNPATLVSLVDFSKGWEIAAPALVALFGFLVIVILNIIGNRNQSFICRLLKQLSVIGGILAGTLLYYILVVCGVISFTDPTTTSIADTFKDWSEYGLFASFKGLKFAFDGQTIGSIFTVVMILISFTLVDMFDTIGTVYGTAQAANMVDENGDPQDLGKTMLTDAIGTVSGALTGTSTITTFVESASGVAAGARTGLASVVTALMLALCLFIAPVAQYVPQAATASALIFVGVLMCKNIVSVNFDDLSEAVPAFVAFVFMPLTYSISNGIMFGCITYVIIRLCTGKFTKKDIVTLIIALLAILKFAFIGM